MKKFFTIVILILSLFPAFSFAQKAPSQSQCKNFTSITSKSIYDTCCTGASPALACAALSTKDQCTLGVLPVAQCNQILCSDISTKDIYNYCCVNNATPQASCSTLSVNQQCTLGILQGGQCSYSVNTKDDYYALCKKNPAQRAGNSVLDQFCQNKETDIAKMCEWQYKSFADCQAYYCPQVVASSAAAAAWSCRNYVATTTGVQDKTWYIQNCDPSLLASSIVDPKIKAACEAKTQDVDTMCSWGVGQFTKDYCQKLYQDRYSICQSLTAGSQEWTDNNCQSVQTGATIWGSILPPQSAGNFNTNTLLAPIPVATSCSAVDLTKVDTKNFWSFFLWIRCYIGKLMPVLLTIATIVFLWNIVNYIIKPNPLKNDERKKYIIAGLIGLFVIVCLWGLVSFASSTLGLGSVVPQLPYSTK